MKNPPYPGLSLRYDCLEPLGLNVTEAANKLGVSRRQPDLVNGHSGISPERDQSIQSIGSDPLNYLLSFSLCAIFASYFPLHPAF